MAQVMHSPADLQSLVKSHSLFFDRLVELIPAKFYLAADDSRTGTHGMSKAEKKAARRKAKENLKKARRNNLDPEKQISTLQRLQQKDESNESTVPVMDSAKVSDSGVKSERAANYEELQERLRKRIEMLRTKRHADLLAAAAKNARNWQDQRKKEAHAQKRKAVSSDHNEPKRQKWDNKNISTKTESNGIIPGQLEFSRVKIDSQSSRANNRQKRRKESKESLLDKANKLQAVIQDPKKGKEVASRHSWNAAVSRAAGMKVFDDPKLLKQSLKKEKQQRHKSAQKWQERKESQKQNFDAKQQKRAEHINQRADAVKERKILKREKKLLRPGFEGRKEGFINT